MNLLTKEISRPTPLKQAGVNEGRLRSHTLQLEEIQPASMFRLRCIKGDTSLAAALSENGITLPLKTGQAAGKDPACLCLRPREWLIFDECSTADELGRQLRTGIEETGALLHDMSDAFAVFRLTGSGAPWLLSKLSCLDFVAGSTCGQHCARTQLAQISVLIHHHACAVHGFCFDLILDRSIAKYLWTLLIESVPHADELAQQWGDRT
jgi:heterotetrameric sarcosine oxidase gamma subunit